MSHSTDAYTHTHTSTHCYEYTRVHPILMSTSKRLDRLDLEIHKVSQRASRYRGLQLKEL
jgi:hypothetical protein